MKILGVETSCDETSAAVVQGGRKILASVVHSQLKAHAPFRGVVPEIAGRAHVLKMNEVIERVFVQAPGKVDAIAVTVGPGLVGSLLIGKMTAEALGWIWSVPVIGVHHLEAHVFSAMLNHPKLNPPFMGLVVSGGHTDLILVEDFGRYTVLGRTRDDAAGESFDKVANLLGIGYPGGPMVDQLARLGNPKAVPFPRPHLHGSWDFSFSGLKTAVLYYLNESKNRASVQDVCASFQSSVVEVLVEKTLRAAKKFGLKSIAVGGGVSANSALRAQFLVRAKQEKRKVYFPDPVLSTDNAAMIASLGYYKLARSQSTKSSSPYLKIDPSLPIQNWD